MSPYRDRYACLTTKHGKALAIARPMQTRLGLNLVTPQNLDTDILGTFSGEIPRKGSAREVCEQKARLGMAATGLPLGLANEGSFGPHPFIPFIPAGIELMTFVDDERGIVVTESFLSDRTNYSHRTAQNIEDLGEWLRTVRFPTHAIVVRLNVNGPGAPIEKGIVSTDRLEAAIVDACANSSGGPAWIETDMRAHFNPTRMVAIRKLGRRLADRLASTCPACSSPGWGQTDVIKGLPCELCGSPSKWVMFEAFGCVACDYRENRRRSDGLQNVSPQHCPECNP